MPLAQSIMSLSRGQISLLYACAPGPEQLSATTCPGQSEKKSKTPLPLPAWAIQGTLVKRSADKEALKWTARSTQMPFSIASGEVWLRRGPIREQTIWASRSLPRNLGTAQTSMVLCWASTRFPTPPLFLPLSRLSRPPAGCHQTNYGGAGSANSYVFAPEPRSVRVGVAASASRSASAVRAPSGGCPRPTPFANTSAIACARPSAWAAFDYSADESRPTVLASVTRNADDNGGDDGDNDMFLRRPAEPFWASPFCLHADSLSVRRRTISPNAVRR